jgi:hypothetical protein
MTVHLYIYCRRDTAGALCIKQNMVASQKISSGRRFIYETYFI